MTTYKTRLVAKDGAEKTLEGKYWFERPGQGRIVTLLRSIPMIGEQGDPFRSIDTREYSYYDEEVVITRIYRES